MKTLKFCLVIIFIFNGINVAKPETFWQKIIKLTKNVNATNFFPIKLFPPNNGTVSKFGPILEYFLQRIQSQNSLYIHEDLSRPPTWEKPVYTLSPEDEAFLASFETTTEEELLFEIIKDEEKDKDQNRNETISSASTISNENQVILLTNQTVQFNNDNIYGTSHIQTSVILGKNNKKRYGLYNNPNGYAMNDMNQKFFWDTIINQIDWLPIEINVPDVVNNIVSGIPSNIGGFIQRIPFINRLTNPNQPRPMSYILLIPNQQLDQKKLLNYFESSGMYP